MTSREFAYWLQGLFELADVKQLDERQTAAVKAHLAMVFLHEIDPSAGPPEAQKKLSEAHGPIGGRLPGRDDVLLRC